jgi:5-methylthioadenosine/S-adenosylhomocysteine deaminase
VQHVDLLVSAPHALTMDGAGVGYQADVAVAVDRGRIVALGPARDIGAEYTAERTLEADHHVMLPGFVDAHMHSALCLLRGLAQDTSHWMMHGLGPFSAQLSLDAMHVGTRIHVHTAQGDRETAQMMLRYGRRSIAWLDALDYLDPNLLAVHLTDASDDEARLVASRGASMALCSGSIGIIDGRVPPAAAFQSVGGTVGLGSDQAPGNNCHNLFNEMKLTALFNKIRAADPEVMPAWRVLRMATIDGAAALGWADEIGSLSVGKRADLVLVDLHRPTLTPVHTRPMRNLAPNLVYAARGDEVDTVVIDGQVVVERGRVTTVDEPAILAQAQRLAEPIGAAAEADFWRVSTTNAQSMRADRL